MTVDDPHRRFASDNPFVGLRAFGVADAELFFGREAQVARLVARLRETRFLATVGASGCGKSSLVLAGLIPALQRAGSSWRIAVMRPGSAPAAALASVLARTQVLGERSADPDAPRAAMLQALQHDEFGLVDIVHQARLRKGESLLVVVDQFEELFRTVDTDPGHASEAAAFVKLLLTAAASKDVPVFVAITMRSDFIGDCAKFRDLPEAVNDGVFLVPRLTRDEMMRAIEEPVLRGGEHVAPQLVARLLEDVGAGADQLPVLEHALMRTWEAWDKDHAGGEPLDVRHYETAGARDALSKHANDIYAGLDVRQQQIAERMFRSLTARDAENRDVRRPMSFGAICAVTAARPGDVERLVRIYAAPSVSFVSISGPLSNPKTVVEIAHESLMRLWDRLRDWVDDEADSGKTYRRLVDDATANRAHWIDPELAVGEAWLAKHHASINPAWAVRYDDALAGPATDETLESRAARERFDAALAFLNASAAAPRRSLGAVIAVLGVLFIAAVALAFFGFTKYNQTVAERHRVEELNKTTVALQHAKAAQTRSLDATIAKAKSDTEAANKRVRDAALAVKAADEKRRQAAAQSKPSPSPSPSASPTAKPPEPTPHPTATPQPVVARSPRPRTAPVRRPAVAALTAAGDANGANAACRRALDDQKLAAETTISRRASYDASVAGLAENARCGNRAARLVNEGYLRSTLAAAEHELGIGDWKADFKRADALLMQCETLPQLQATTAPADCLAQRYFNEQTEAAIAPSPTPNGQR
jgi:energy-coupling factor transporter ATP-binding protein EcfA2